MVDLTTHKLLAMATLDDNFAHLLSDDAAEAFWRGFLLEDRKTGVLSFTFRFSYVEKGRSWTNIEFVTPRASLEDLIEEIKLKMAMALLSGKAAKAAGMGPEAFRWHEVPVADREDSKRTMIWMEMQDLVHEPRFVPAEGGDGN